MLPTDWYPQGHVHQDRVACLCVRQWMGVFTGLALAVICLGIVLNAGRSRALAWPARPLDPEQEICGDISANATWTLDQSPYHVTCETTLLPGVTLDIEPGVEVRFSTGVTFTISGTLQAMGTPAQPITFTSALEPPGPGDWGGLRFVGGSSGSELAWCVVEYATLGLYVYAGPGETVSPALYNCTVRRSAVHGIMLEGYTRDCDVGLVQPVIANCLVEDNGGCGVYGYGHGDPQAGCVEFAGGSVGGVVTGSMIRRNQGPGICLNAETVQLDHGDVWLGIEANAISDNDGHGLYFYGDDRVRPGVENNLIYGNAGAGLYSDAKHKELELPVVNNTIYQNGGDGLVLARPATQARLANNILAANGGYALVCGADAPQIANNDLWLNAGGEYSGCPAGLSDIYADPQFVDPAIGDFHLPFGSPCVDAGTSDGAPDTDIEGIARPQGDGVDIGAHELWYQKIYLPVLLRGFAGVLEDRAGRVPAGG